jgi:hypothetical protein
MELRGKAPHVLQNCLQPTHIVRVLGARFAITGTNEKRSRTHASCEEEKSQEGPEGEEGQKGEKEEEVVCVEQFNVDVTVLPVSDVRSNQ